MTEVLSDSNFLSPATSLVKRTSSEPDISGGGFRLRKCSNASQLQYNRTRGTTIASGGNNELSRSPTPTVFTTDADDEMLVNGTGSSLDDSQCSFSSEELVTTFRQRAPTSPY
ncbi:PREDICTED: uncharacterized protein LOC107341685 [Acropora digitifera]|uniref:uncharacterized protein LOC107341685 n=1 Tax=Acropora digitifera TaxID=70779 RepID=UPI00077A2E37|nr:PREDICTED: uncharacterized protein LOC107341685 [Acropora digitifera]